MRWLDRYLNGVALGAIDRELLNRIAQHKKAEGVSNTTVNRMLEVIRAILRKAMSDWKWIDKVLRIRMLPEPKRRIRSIPGRKPKGCSRSYRSIFAPWRGSARRRGCASPTSPDCSGRRWIYAGDVRGFTRTRRRDGRRLPCHSPRQPSWFYANRWTSIRCTFSVTGAIQSSSST
jgi:hypothetical protein